MDRMRNLARREFLSRVAGAGTIATLHATSHLGSGVARAAGRSLSLANATSNSFRKLVGEPFRVMPRGGPAYFLQLVDVSLNTWPPGRNEARKQFRRSFSLVFRGPNDLALSEATYRFQHRTFGAFELFITPAESREGDTAYIAIIG